MIRLLIGCAALGLLIWVGLVAFVAIKEKTVPASRPQDTQAIIVLGAQVKADGSLSVQLQWRLDKALEVYRAYPQPIVVCGAQGANEPVTEASAMRDYLLQNGVPEADILLEDQSFNTRQNLKNAQRLLGEGVKKVLIVTSNYHLPGPWRWRRIRALSLPARAAPSNGIIGPRTISGKPWPGSNTGCKRAGSCHIK